MDNEANPRIYSGDTQALEILAPVGSPAHLLPAARCGANAVYLGFQDMNARANAVNFDETEFRDAVRYCHERDIKVYGALNTLVKDREMKRAERAAALACETGVDALIVQDIGLAARLRRAAPGLPLHASTQMSVHTPQGAQLLYDQGFRRAVLARECSKEEIAAIAAVCPIELEVFVHGALCMSVSGQCYLSAMLGGLSGNRGQCAQPCRLPFHVPGSPACALSLKDLSMLSRLTELRGLGVVSAKIEGRMKRPEYVAAAVRACRQMVDQGYMSEDAQHNLERVFSRSGFTKGYYDGKIDADMFGVRSKEDVTAATGKVLAHIRQTYKDERGSIPVSFFLRVAAGEQTVLRAWENRQSACTVTVYGQMAERAVNRPLDADRCRAGLLKTGGTPFVCDAENIEIDMEGDIALPVSELNRLRRDALDRLLEKRAQRVPISWRNQDRADAPLTAAPLRGTRRGDRAPLRAHFRTADLPKRAKDCALCYLPLFTPSELLKKRVEEGFSVGVELPRGMFSLEGQVEKALARAYAAGVRDAWTGNLGGIPLIQRAGMTVHGGFGLNVMNGYSLEQVATWGAADCELSFELSIREIAAMPKVIPVGVPVYGRLPLMLTRSCPFKSAGMTCSACAGDGVLTDRKGMTFPVGCTTSCAEIFNAVPLEMSDRLQDFTGVNFISLRFTVENSVETEEKLQQYMEGRTPKTGYTRGLFDRSVE